MGFIKALDHDPVTGKKTPESKAAARASIRDWATPKDRSFWSKDRAPDPREEARAKPSEADLQEKTRSFPAVVTFEGRRYGRTGKVGTNAKSGLPSAEYRNSDKGDDRVWRDASGKVARD